MSDKRSDVDFETATLSFALATVIVFASACGSAGDTSSTTTGAGGGGGATSAATSGSATTAQSAGSTSSATGAGGGGNACATLPLCDDFEAAVAGGPPDPSKWDVVQPDCGGGPAIVAVDDKVSHSGSKSVRVDGGLNYCDHKFFADQKVIKTLGAVVYARYFIRFADPIGQNHVTFLSMKDMNAGGKNLRMGGQGHVFMYNRETDDAVVPSNFSNSQAPVAATWYCVELEIDGPGHQIQTWIDGVDAPGLRVDGTPTQGIDDVWLSDPSWAPSLVDFRLGWESYANQAMTVWFDDVALSTARIGCQ